MRAGGTHPFFAALGEPGRAQRPAIRAEGVSLSHAALGAQLAALAGALEAQGVTPGQRVLVLLPDSAEHILAVLALVALGAVAVPVHPEAGRRRLAHILDLVQPQRALLPPGAGAPGGVAALQLELEEGGSLRLDGRFLPPAAAPLQPRWPGEEQAAMIRFSSGSTGAPKGVLLGHGHLLWSARTLSRVFGLAAGHRELLLASMAYSGAWQRVVATLYAGGCVHLFQGPPVISVILEEMERGGIQGFYTPPPLVRMLLGAPAERLRAAMASCRTIEIGSAPVTAAELDQLARRLPHVRLFVHYGMTECSRACILDASAHARRRHTVGRPAPGVEVRVVDGRGRALPPGQAGQIRLRGPQLALGYLGRAPAAAFAGGWLATGDHGVLEEGGYLRFLGRSDDRINCGGHSFFPAEVEAELGRPQGVRALLVAGVPDPRGVLGQVPWAFVVPEDPASWSPGPFLLEARRRLAPHMVPRGVTTLPELPLTASGKPDRRRTLELHSPAGEQ